MEGNENTQTATTTLESNLAMSSKAGWRVPLRPRYIPKENHTCVGDIYQEVNYSTVFYGEEMTMT